MGNGGLLFPQAPGAGFFISLGRRALTPFDRALRARRHATLRAKGASCAPRAFRAHDRAGGRDVDGRNESGHDVVNNAGYYATQPSLCGVKNFRSMRRCL